MTDDFNGQAINVIDSEKTTIDEFYKRIAGKYFPNKKYKTIYFPASVGKIIGILSSALSYILKTKQPIFDPSYYALHHISSNLDFDNRKMTEILHG